MQGDFYYRFLSAIMPDRLNPYRKPGFDDLDVACNYLWNVVLSESLYPSLHSFEVGLRNALHNALAYRFGQPDWYDSPRLFLNNRAMESIYSAKDTLTNAGKVVTPGGMVAELHFGFWVSLFNRTYERPHTRLWPAFIPRVFPFKPKNIYLREHVANRVERIRKLRNRAFHHERITHWRLSESHTILMDTIEWMNPALHHATMSIDRFPVVLSRGWADLRRQIATTTLPPEYFI
jgi:hypothetical protein